MKEQFIKWHKSQIKNVQKYLNINEYQTLWISWAKGLVIGMLFMALLSGCSNKGTQTFNEMLMVSQEAAFTVTKEAVLYDAEARPSMKYIETVYRGDDEWPALTIRVTNNGKYSIIKDTLPYLECLPIPLPPKMTLEQAEDSLAASKYACDWEVVVLRAPLGPIEEPPLYIFTCPKEGYIGVNTWTGIVGPMTTLK